MRTGTRCCSSSFRGSRWRRTRTRISSRRSRSSPRSPTRMRTCGALRPSSGRLQAAVSFPSSLGSSRTRQWSRDTRTSPRTRTGLQVGDVIESLDGTPVQELVKRWEPYYPASNQPTRLRDIARALTRGACATARLGIRVQPARSRSLHSGSLSPPGPAGRPHSRPARRHVPSALRSGGVSEAVLGAGRASRQLHRALEGHARIDHRHPQLSVRVRRSRWARCSSISPRPSRDSRPAISTILALPLGGRAADR